MTILLLGGRGKTSTSIAPLLQAANLPFLVASRSSSQSSPYKQAHFDWLDEATFGNPAKVCQEQHLDPISAVWLVPPPVFDLAPPMIKFIDFMRERGLRRYVLLSASTIEKGGPAMGEVHEHLAELKGIEWVVLRPTWFMENFSAGQEPQRLSILHENKIYSAAGDGKIPFVSTHDIARIAVRALTDKKMHNSDHIILGPELLSYDQVAGILTQVIGREITHARLTESQLAKRLEEAGMTVEEGEMVASMDTMIKDGAEDRLNNVVEDLTGVPPRSFHDFAQRERESWIKEG